jgi:hypothetical protein
MFQKDYILRMIEMAAAMIAGILGLIKKGKLDEASRELDIAYNSLLREDSAFFQAIPAEDITDRLLHDHNYTNGHLEILAELMYAEAELEMANGNRQESLEFSEKSLVLFKFIDMEMKTFSQERLDKIEELSKKISELKESKI